MDPAKNIHNFILKEIQDTKRFGIQKNSKQFAVFDFDYTTITNDIADLVLIYLCSKNKLRNNRLLNNNQPLNSKYHQNVFQTYWKLHLKGKVKAFKLITRSLSGFSEAEIKSIVKKVIAINKTHGSWTYSGITIRGGILLRKVTIKMMHFLHKQGLDIHIISASPTILVKSALQELNGPKYISVCGIKQGINQGVYTTRVYLPLPAYKGKVTCIKRISKNRPLVAVGDSANDEAMLRYARVPIVINRNTNFSNSARKNGRFLI